MRVRRMRRRDPRTGAATERWFVDVDFELADGKRERVRKVSPVQVQEVPTFDGFKDRFLTYSEVNNKPSTVYSKRYMLRLHLLPFFGQMKLERIGPAEIEAFKARKLAEGQSQKSINNMLTAVRKLLNLAVEWEVIPRAPKVRAFRFKNEFITEDQFLSFEEADRFVRAAAPEWRPFIVTALKTGLRVGELLALRWEDLDLVAGQLVVRRTLWHKQEGPPKGGRNRKVPLSDEAIAVLRAHRHLKGPYVFCETDGTRLTHSRVKDVVPSTCRRAQLAKRFTTHPRAQAHLREPPGDEGCLDHGCEGAARPREHRDDAPVQPPVAGREEGRGEAAGRAGRPWLRQPDGNGGRFADGRKQRPRQLSRLPGQMLSGKRDLNQT